MSGVNKCCRCEKRVYPIEELKCLDKVWHKTCFKCQECGMTLNLKTYKGYNKMPYCNAHVPQVKYTAVADTPEARRLAENTRIQSNIKYHQDFEKLKGKVTQVADDPETLRILNSSKIISNVAYHGDLEKKKQMEEKRSLLPDSNGVLPDNQNNGDSNQAIRAAQPVVKNDLPSPNSMANKTKITNSNPNTMPASVPANIITTSVPINNSSLISTMGNMTVSGVGSGGDRAGDRSNSTTPSHRMSSTQAYMTSNYARYQDPIPPSPVKDDSPYSSKLKSTVIYTSGQGTVNDAQTARKVGSIADYDPINDNYGSIASGYRRENQGTYYYNQQQQPLATPNMMAQQANRGYRMSGRSFRAMYDYTAQDSDEVSFREGDLIVNCQSIDEGWMTGTVQRTGLSGMLPANYVEPYN